MLNLSGDTWELWDKKHGELEAERRWDIAGLFRGYEGSEFRSAAKKILYMGKATRGGFAEENLEEEVFYGKHSAFWTLADRLNRLAGGTDDGRERLAWSNVCKIGVVSGNPDDQLVNAQAELAVQTLQQEWRELKPTLVFCVSAGFAEEIVYRAIGVTKGADDGFTEVQTAQDADSDDPKTCFWFRPRDESAPAILWMYHPERKLKNYIARALIEAEKLLLTN